MFYDTESHPLPDDKELRKKLVDEDSRSNSRIKPTIISQKHSDVAKCDNIVLTSIDKYENDHLSASTSGRVETREDDKDESDKTISIIDKEITRNNSKVKFLSIFNSFDFC